MKPIFLRKQYDLEMDDVYEGAGVLLEAPIVFGIFLSPCANCSRSAGLK
jgi:hypothetical protein